MLIAGMHFNKVCALPVLSSASLHMDTTEQRKLTHEYNRAATVIKWHSGYTYTCASQTPRSADATITLRTSNSCNNISCR
eukprot:4138-Heterococcus_DN1.PRE.2